MLFLIEFLFNIVLLKAVLADLEGYIVNGHEAAIRDFSYSVHLSVTCREEIRQNWACGGSVLNQVIVLTAAHCLSDCQSSKLSMFASVGNSLKKQGFISSVIRYKYHEKYSEQYVLNDVGVVMVRRPFLLGPEVGRVILMRHPPTNRPAWVAGWGVTDILGYKETNYLMFARQKIWSREDCKKTLFRLPSGCICAGERNNSGFAAEGDSGSALVLRKYIQIGIVSYKVPSLSESLVVYSDVAHYYSWIKKSAKQLYCYRPK